MKYRVVSIICLALAVVILSQSAVTGQVKDAKNSHIGTLVSVKGSDFVMETKGKEHTHTLANGAKITDQDGKACKLEDLKKGQLIRVTTKEGDTKVATKVEAMKKGS